MGYVRIGFIYRAADGSGRVWEKVRWEENGMGARDLPPDSMYVTDAQVHTTTYLSGSRTRDEYELELKDGKKVKVLHEIGDKKGPIDMGNRLLTSKAGSESISIPRVLFPRGERTIPNPNPNDHNTRISSRWEPLHQISSPINPSLQQVVVTHQTIDSQTRQPIGDPRFSIMTVSHIDERNVFLTNAPGADFNYSLFNQLHQNLSRNINPDVMTRLVNVEHAISSTESFYLRYLDLLRLGEEERIGSTSSAFDGVSAAEAFRAYDVCRTVPRRLNAFGIQFHWMHLIAYSMWGSKSNHAQNLVVGTAGANGKHLRAEIYIKHIIKRTGCDAMIGYTLIYDHDAHTAAMVCHTPSSFIYSVRFCMYIDGTYFFCPTNYQINIDLWDASYPTSDVDSALMKEAEFLINSILQWKSELSGFDISNHAWLKNSAPVESRDDHSRRLGRLRYVNPDGNCLFSAIASALNRRSVDGAYLRSFLTEQHHNTYVQRLLMDNESMHFDQAVAHANKMKNLGGRELWGGDTEIRALSHLLNRRIIIIHRGHIHLDTDFDGYIIHGDSRANIDNLPFNANPLVIFLNDNQDHYSWFDLNQSLD